MASRFLVPLSGRSVGRRTPSIFDLHREVNRLFDDVFHQLGGGRGEGDSGDSSSAIMAGPRIDVHDTQDGLELTAELPGVEQNNVDIQLDDDVVTIRGEKRNERRDAKAHVVERSYGRFERSVQLPFTPDPEKVQANFNNGVLTIQVARAQQQNRSRRIEIGGSQSAQAGQPSGTGQAAATASDQGSASQSGQTDRSPETTAGQDAQPGGETGSSQSSGEQSAFFRNQSGAATEQASKDQSDESRQTEQTNQLGGE